jgi:DNA-binding transcriptional MerR regulator
VAEYRVAEVARLAGMTVRNVRVYQDRGLLPPPRRQGRIGLYSDEHLARLRLIGRLLDRGYTFATIGELFDTWSRGHDLADALGLREAIAAPWSTETPVRMSRADLRRRLGRDAIDTAQLERAVELGLLIPQGTTYVVPSPRLLEAGAELAAAGVPMSTVLDLAAALRDDMATVARRFFDLLLTRAASHDGDPDFDPATFAETVIRLRPHAQRTVDALLAMAMQKEADRLLSQIAGEAEPPSSAPAAG